MTIETVKILVIERTPLNFRSLLRALARRVSGWIGLLSLLLAVGAAVAAPAITAAQSTPIFDHPALQRYDIPLSALPADSIIKNRQDSAWELYQGPMIAAAAVMAILLILVVVLIIVTRRMNHARLALGRLNATLETQVQERTAMLNQTNTQLQDEITERKRTEMALHESEERFRSLFDSQESNILVLDFDGVHHYVNQVGVSSITGSGTVQEIIGKRLHDLYPARVADWQLERIRRVITTGQGMSGDYQNDLDNQSNWWHLNLQPIRNASGQVVQVMVNSLDITERKHTEQTLRESETNLSSLIENTDGSIWAVDKTYGLIVGNEEFHRNISAVLGRRLEMGETVLLPNFPPEASAEWRDYYDRALQGETFSVEAVTRFRETPHYIEYRLSPIRETGEGIRGVTIFGRDITARKQAEEALRENTSLLRAMAENYPNSYISIIEEDLTVGYTAGQEFKKLNLDPNQFVGLKLEQVFGEHTPLVRENYLKTFDGVETQFELFINDQHQSYRTVPLLDSTGRIHRILSVVEVITERKQAENALRESNAYLENLITYANAPIIVWDPQFKITRFNHAFEMLTGRNAADVVGQPLDLLFPPEQIAASMAHIKTTLTGERWEVVEIDIQHVDGSIRTVLWNSATLFAADGVTPQATIAQGQDITERKHVEEALAQSLQRFKALLSQAPFAGVLYRFIYDNDGNITDWEISDINAQGAANIGLTLEAAIGKRALTLFGERIMAPYFEVARQVVASGQPRMFETYFEVNDRHYLTSAFMVDSEHYAIMSVDITDRKRAEAEVRQLNAELEKRVLARTAQLEAANKELEAFSYSAAHDLRAPLRGIDGWSMALLEDYGPQLDAQAHAYLNRVRGEAQHMGQLIDALQQLARVTRSDLHLTKVDLSALTHTIAARLEAAQPERRVEFVIQPGLVAHGDSNLLEIMLTDLLDNAVKFTGTRPLARIEFGRIEDFRFEISDLSGAEKSEMAETAGHAVLNQKSQIYYVRDNGAGFDPTCAQHLFVAFQRLHGPAEFPGTGIGLVTVRRILHRHGGEIWAEAAVDQGATFYFTLPNPDL